MLAIVFAIMLQKAATGQASTGQVVWEAPPPERVVAPVPVEIPSIPDWARSDPYGYERAECSPLVRAAEETMEGCQGRVRRALAANLGDALPSGLAFAGASDDCRQEASGDRYALQCGAPSRSAPPAPDLRVRSCTTRPRATERGAVTYEEVCTVDGGEARDEGLRIRLRGD